MSPEPSSDPRSQDNPEITAPCPEWSVEIKLTHIDCNPADILVHFQGQYVSTCELDYNILRVEIQNAEKVRGSVDVGQLCLVEDYLTANWYRGRVQNKQKDLYNVFLIDSGNVLTVSDKHLANASDELFMLSPKIVCGFFANVLPLGEKWMPQAVEFFSSFLGTVINGNVHALLPHKVLILEAPAITKDLSSQNLGRPVDTGTFLLLVEMLTEVPVRPDYEQIPDLPIERPTENGLSFKPPRVQGVENILSCCGSQQTVGEKVMVRLSAAINSDVFYCQTLCKEEELKMMSKKLADLWESKREYIKDTSEGNLGLLCAVRGKDEKWHRGYVQTLPVDSQVRVLFVDYGYSELVKVENICQLHSDFIDRPIMAFPCALSSLGEDETVKKQQCDLLMKGLLGSALTVQINDFDKEQNFYHVTLCSAEHLPETKTVTTPDLAAQTSTAHEDNPPSQFIPLRCTNETRIIHGSSMKEDFAVGAVFDGYVEHIVSPTTFWIRTAKRNEAFEDLMALLKEYLSPLKQNDDVLDNAVPGTLCLAMFKEDRHYYRAIITDTLTDGVEVYFFDFGNTEVVPYFLIKTLPERFTSEPEFAIKCSLANAMPTQEDWTEADSEYFTKMTANKALKIHVLQKTNERLFVDLSEIGTENRESVSLLMNSKGCQNIAPVSPSDLDLKQNSKTQKAKPFQQESFIPTQENLQMGNVRPDQETAENVKVKHQNGPGFFKIQRFRLGEELIVRCCNFSSPSDFWCQIENQRCDFDKLMDEMQVFYQTCQRPLSSNEVFCAIKMTEDDRWYRGYIMSRRHIHCQVFLVDYGIVRQEMMTKLQTLAPEFNLLVWQAFRCTLYNLIEPVGGKLWSREACQSLKEFMSGKTTSLRCIIHAELNVKHFGLCNVVDLHTPSQQATTLLVRQGLAAQVQPPKRLIETAYPLSFMYSTFGITIGSKEEVYATHVASPWEIYCQLDRNTEIVEDLMDKVEKESHYSPCDESIVNPGSLCIAKYKDGQWYRTTTSPVISSQLFNVFFVDFGNRQIVEERDVQALRHSATDLLMTPMQAIRCSLVNIPKGETLAEVNSWLENNILNKPMQATFVGKDSDGTFICDMFCDGAHVSAKIKEIIANHEEIERGSVLKSTHAKDGSDENQRDGQSLKDHRRRVKSDFSQVRKWINATHNSCPKTNVGRTGKKPLVKKTQQPQKRKQEQVPQPQKSKEVQALQPQKQSQEQILQPLKQNQDQIHPPEGSVVALPKLISLPAAKAKAGLKGVGFASHVDTFKKFFIQMQEDEADILKMGEDLNATSFKEKAETITAKVQNGDLVAAEFSEDGALYRAVVTDDSEEGHLTIEFIDYGNIATVDHGKLYRLTNQFLSHPRLCAPCTLVETHPLVNHSSFGDIIKDKPFEVEFIRHTGTQWEVDLKEFQQSVTSVTSKHDTESKEETKEPSVSDLCKSEVVIKHEQVAAVPCQKTVCSTTHVRNSHIKKKRLGLRRKYNSLQKCIGVKQSAPKVNPPDLVIGTGPTSVPVTRELTEEGTLLTILDNGHLYVRLACHDAQLAALQSLIDETEPGCHFVPLNNVKEGLACLIKSQRSKQWCRAVVSHVSIKEGKCTVKCLDYGDTEMVSVKCIKALPDDVRQIPAQAVHCRWNVTRSPPPELKDILSPLVGQNIRLMFKSYSDVFQLWDVEILMNDSLIQRQSTQSHHAEEKKTHLASSDINLAHIDEKQPRKLSTCSVEIGLEYSGFVTAATNPGEFCIALDDEAQNTIMNVVSDTLLSLQDLSPLPEAHLIPGTACLIKYKDTNNLCRAEILHVDTESVLMNLVDIGVCTHILRESQVQLKILPDKLARLPKMIYPCLVRGVIPAEDGQWTDQAAVFFQELISNKDLKIIFRRCIFETKWEVDISIDGVSLATALVDAGHALCIDSLLVLGIEQECSQMFQMSTEESVPDRPESNQNFKATMTGHTGEMNGFQGDTKKDEERECKTLANQGSGMNRVETSTMKKLPAGVKQCMLQ